MNENMTAAQQGVSSHRSGEIRGGFLGGMQIGGNARLSEDRVSTTMETALSEVTNGLMELSSRIGTLEQRIAPVLQPAAPAAIGNAEAKGVRAVEPPHSAAVIALYKHREQIDLLLGRVIDLSNRVEA
ncbi:MAG: hypothetical protein H7255_09055 [Ramlibacter sp.]|nr:hypothetical protein [Ramlibacter sp.]